MVKFIGISCLCLIVLVAAGCTGPSQDVEQLKQEVKDLRKDMAQTRDFLKLLQKALQEASLQRQEAIKKAEAELYDVFL